MGHTATPRHGQHHKTALDKRAPTLSPQRLRHGAPTLVDLLGHLDPRNATARHRSPLILGSNKFQTHLFGHQPAQHLYLDAPQLPVVGCLPASAAGTIPRTSVVAGHFVLNLSSRTRDANEPTGTSVFRPNDLESGATARVFPRVFSLSPDLLALSGSLHTAIYQELSTSPFCTGSMNSTGPPSEWARSLRIRRPGVRILSGAPGRTPSLAGFFFILLGIRQIARGRNVSQAQLPEVPPLAPRHRPRRLRDRRDCRSARHTARHAQREALPDVRRPAARLRLRRAAGALATTRSTRGRDAS